MAKISSVCVYCGSRTGAGQAHRRAAAELGRTLAEAGIGLVYGGGGVGLMGELADAALAAGGRVTGVIPALLTIREQAHPDISELIQVDSMHARKQRMFELSDGFVALPGGLGTLDETIEVVTWRQLGLHDKPLVLVSVDGYWKPLAALVEHAIAAGFAGAPARALFHLVERVDQVVPALAAAAEPRLPAAPQRL